MRPSFADDAATDERIRSDRALLAELHARNARSDQGKAVLNEAVATIRDLLGARFHALERGRP